jgi:hypothetical protein
LLFLWWWWWVGGGVLVSFLSSLNHVSRIRSYAQDDFPCTLTPRGGVSEGGPEGEVSALYRLPDALVGNRFTLLHKHNLLAIPGKWDGGFSLIGATKGDVILSWTAHLAPISCIASDTSGSFACGTRAQEAEGSSYTGIQYRAVQYSTVL